MNSLKDLRIGQLSKSLIVSYLILMFFGGYLAYYFAKIDDPEKYPLLINLLGIGLDFVGVILLSDQFIKIPEQFQNVYELVLGIVLGLPFMLSMGMVLYVVPAAFFGWEISDLWENAVDIVFSYVGITLYGAVSIADVFRIKLKTRIAFHGWFFLASGLVLQMYSTLLQVKS